MIYIVLDSNILYIDCKNNFLMDVLSFSDQVKNLLKMKSQGDLGDQVKILVPEVVIRELSKQRMEAYENVVTEVRKIRRSISGYGKVDFIINDEEYRKDVCKQFSEWLDRNDIDIIPTCDESYFNKIIDDALEKRPPFEGKEKKSDKGFKNVLIFYSIISYAKEHSGNYYIFTNDTIFNGNGSRNNFDYFKKETGCILEIVKKLEDIIIREKEEPKEFIEKIEYKNVEREYVLKKTHSHTFATVFHYRPVILGQNKIVNIINEDIDSIFLSDKNYWLDLYDSKDTDLYEDCEGNLRGIVTINEKGLLCIRFMGDIWLGGVVNPNQIGRVYDLNTGCILGLPQLLKMSDRDIISLVIEKQKEDYNRNENKYWDDFEPKYESVDDIKFYVNSKGVHVFFDVYEAGCGDAGNIDFLLMDIGQLLDNMRRV